MGINTEIILNGISLHSRYRPEMEAERYLQSLKLPNQGTLIPPLFILIDPAAGYLYKSLKQQYPESRFLILFSNTLTEELFLSFHQSFNLDVKSKRWCYSSQIDFFSFVNESFSEWDIPSLHVVDWPPVIKIFPEEIKQIKSNLSMYIKRLSANMTTSAGFSRRWIRNGLRQARFLRRIKNLSSCTLPVCIAASGPSLQENIQELVEHRNLYHLWALPSSLGILKYHGLVPDLIISTDPGYYAQWHLQGLCSDIPLALPITAAIPLSLLKHQTIIPFRQSEWFEKNLWESSGMTPPLIPSHGTVAGTALFLAKEAKAPFIFFSGLDFCQKDLISHALPHPFHLWEERQSSRISPLEDRLFKRSQQVAPNKSGPFRSGASLIRYKEWFQNETTNNPIYILENSLPNKIFPVIKWKEIMIIYNSQLKESKLNNSVNNNLYSPIFDLSEILHRWQEEIKSKSDQINFKNYQELFNSTRFFDMLVSLDIRSLITFNRILRTETNIDEHKWKLNWEKLICKALKQLEKMKNRDCLV